VVYAASSDLELIDRNIWEKLFTLKIYSIKLNTKSTKETTTLITVVSCDKDNMIEIDQSTLKTKITSVW